MPRTLVPIRGEQQQVSQTIIKATTATILTLRVPADVVFLLESFGNDVSAASAWGKLVWRVKRNGVPQTPLNNQLDRFGSLQTPAKLGRPIFFDGADLLEVEVQNTDAADDFGAFALVQGNYYRYAET